MNLVATQELDFWVEWIRLFMTKELVWELLNCPLPRHHVPQSWPGLRSVTLWINQSMRNKPTLCTQRVLPLWLRWLRICLQCGRPGFHPWVGKIPWRRERLPTPIFWTGEFRGLYSSWDHRESDTTEELSHTHCTQKDTKGPRTVGSLDSSKGWWFQRQSEALAAIYSSFPLRIRVQNLLLSDLRHPIPFWTLSSFKNHISLNKGLEFKSQFYCLFLDNLEQLT